MVFVARRKEKLQEIFDLIQDFNRDCFAFPADISKEEEVNALFREILCKYGRIDILINNAGRGLKAGLCDTSYADWIDIMNANLNGVFLCTRAAVKNMREQESKGHIITVSSIVGRFGAPQHAAYSASKHGVTGFTKSLWWELLRCGIKVSTIHPARVDTDFFTSYPKKPSRNQMVQPEDIAHLLVALSKGSFFEIGWVRLRNTYKRIRNAILL